MKIVPSNEAKNFSSIVTVTVPEVSADWSGGLSGVPGSRCVPGEPRKKMVPSTPASKPMKRTSIDFFIAYGVAEAAGDAGGVLEALASMALRIEPTALVKASIC